MKWFTPLSRRCGPDGRDRSGSDSPQPAIMRTHSRACRLSVTPGNNRRSSITAESSPRWRKASRIAVAPASVTENMTGGWACAVAGASRPLARIIGMRPGDDEVALTALSPGFEGGAGEERVHNERRSSPREAVRAHSSFSLGTSSLGTFLRPGRGQSVARVIVCYETSGPVIWPDGHDKTMRHRYDIPMPRSPPDNRREYSSEIVPGLPAGSTPYGVSNSRVVMTSVRLESRSNSLTVLSLSKAFYFTRSLKAMTPAFVSEMITPVARHSMAVGTNSTRSGSDPAEPADLARRRERDG